MLGPLKFFKTYFLFENVERATPKGFDGFLPVIMPILF
jgi:hypothetical protein